MNETREQRVKTVNKIIKKIANNDRGFFYSSTNDAYGYFKLINNRVYFVDEYTKETLYAYGHKYLRKGFNQGGTMEALVLDFSEFIRTGKYTNGNNGYNGLFCTHWGYSNEAMQDIQKLAKKLGYLKEDGAE